MSSKKVNISVLSASVNEHQHQLKWHMHRPLVQFFRKLYSEAVEKADQEQDKKPSADLLMFQVQLKLIPKWNQKTLETIVDLIVKWRRNKHFQINQSIKTVVVGRTMLMVAMGNANSEVDDRIRVDIPDHYSFLHSVLSLVAYDLYTYPSLMRINKRETEVDIQQKQDRVQKIIDEAIENAIIDQISSPAVFAYLDEAMDTANFDTDAVDPSDDTADSAINPGFDEDEEEDEEEVDDHKNENEAVIATRAIPHPSGLPPPVSTQHQPIQNGLAPVATQHQPIQAQTQTTHVHPVLDTQQTVNRTTQSTQQVEVDPQGMDTFYE